MKGRLPFRLGSSSFIKEADVLTNLHFLKDKVDHVELLFFETDETWPYPSAKEIRQWAGIAADYNLTYSIHLPIGIKLGTPDPAIRQQLVDAMLRIIDLTRCLNPLAYDMHLELNDEQHWPAWQEACLDALNRLKAGGANPAITGVENLDYDYARVWPLLQETGFSTCFDVGHLWHRQADTTYHLKTYLPNASSCHLHGFDTERDHRSLRPVPAEWILQFIDAVKALERPIPVTLELFAETPFLESLERLHHLLNDAELNG
jgi:sugar phosphate isomerase/epimerase